MAEVRAGFVQAGPVRLECFEAGEGPRTAVLVHGAASSARIWHSVQLALAEAGIRTVALGMRGAGGSDRPEHDEDYTPTQYAADTLAAVDALGLGAFTLVGHSLGTIVARYVVRDHPERVAALVLMSGPDPARGPLSEEERRRRAALPAAAREGQEQPSDTWTRQHLGLPEEVRAALWHDIRNNPPQRARGQGSPWPGLEGEAAKIGVPALVVCGDADDVVPPETAVRGWLELPAERRHLHVFHGAGHYPNAQVPDRLAGVVRSFMDVAVPAE
jgi:non-heme chloroperoxidase